MLNGTNGDGKWEDKKDHILFAIAVGGIIFEGIIVPILGPLMGVQFRIEILLFFGGMIGIPLARFGDRK